MTTAREDYPNLHAFADVLDWRPENPQAKEASRALDEIDSLRAALRLSQDARRGTR